MPEVYTQVAADNFVIEKMTWIAYVYIHGSFCSHWRGVVGF
jgi:hypothetical protein